MSLSFPPGREALQPGRIHVLVTAMSPAQRTGTGTEQVLSPNKRVLVIFPQRVSALGTEEPLHHSLQLGPKPYRLWHLERRRKNPAVTVARGPAIWIGGYFWPQRETREPGEMGEESSADKERNTGEKTQIN